MRREEWEKLSEGDIIRHKESSSGFTVGANYQRFGVLLVRTLLAHAPDEWDLVATARYTMNGEDEAYGVGGNRSGYPGEHDNSSVSPKGAEVSPMWSQDVGE